MQPIEGLIGNRWPLGVFRQYQETAAIAPAANAIMAAFRFTAPKAEAIPVRCFVTVNVVTAVTAQRVDPLRLFQARAYTARDATNATAVVISAAMAKVRTSMADSLLAVAAQANGNFDVASAAAGLTGGTKVVDTNPMGAFAASGLVAIGTSVQGDVYNLITQGGHPPVLQPQAQAAGTAGGEGLLLQWGATALATGTVTVGFGIEWAESTVA